ncbi:MAG: flagellar protein FliS [Deltaproteobacteria bacterium]|nr:flagellar protein FliS [Deltaproteobacteria bacterium]
METATNTERMHADAKTGAMCSGGILIALYNAAIRFAQDGRDQITAGDTRTAGVTLGRVYSIIAELAASLDHDKAPELCDNLEKIYSSMLEGLIAADAKMDANRLNSIITSLRDLRNTWAQALAQVAADEAQIPAIA